MYNVVHSFSRQWEKGGLIVTKMVASVRNKGKIISYKKVFTLRVFVLRDDFPEGINRAIRGFAALLSQKY
jgi:hypothetical protein